MSLSVGGIADRVGSVVRDSVKQLEKNFEDYAADAKARAADAQASDAIPAGQPTSVATPRYEALAHSGRPLPGDYGGTTIPARDTDPTQVAQWWTSLTPGQREQLIDKDYAELGMLRGLPAQDMDTINRNRLDHDESALESRLADLDAAIDDFPKEAPINEDPKVPHVNPDLQKLLDERDRVRTALTNVKEMQNQMNKLDDAYKKGDGPKPYLLTYLYQNEGRFAVALGNPDTADNTAVLVPGAGHDVEKEKGEEVLFPTVQEGIRVYNHMNDIAGDKGSWEPEPRGYSNSVIVWLGTDMPDAPVSPDVSNSGLNPTFGDTEHGAKWLSEDVAGYQAAVTNPDNHMTLIAHSYGSYMAGEAIDKLGLQVDDLVVFGSPGIDADNAADMGMQGHVWAGVAEGDTLVTQGPLTAQEGWLGTNPASISFGAKVFGTDGSNTLAGSEGHGEYLKPNSESLDNIAKIATRQDDQVSRGPYVG